ncbi:MAG: hypothetical protein ACYTET_05650 [Planctomycetota bacterium]|jgi:hypothetical protein
MTQETKLDAKSSRKKALKVLKWTLIGSAGFGLLIFFGLPIFLSSSGGTNFLLGKINAAVDGQVQMEDFSIGWLKGVELTNLSYADGAGTTSVTADRIETQPNYASLLGGKVKLGKTIVDHPQVYVKVLPEKPSQKMSQSPSETVADRQEDKPVPVFPVHEIDLEVIDGAATVELAGDVPQTVSFANITSKVTLAAPGNESTLDVSMEIPDGRQPSRLSAKGSVTTDTTGWTIADGSFDVTISDLQLESLKPLLAMAGRDMDAAGQLNASAKIEVADNQLRQVKADAVITDFAQGIGDERIAFKKPVEMSASIGNVDGTILIDKAFIKSDFCRTDCFGSLESLTYDVSADLTQTQRFVAQFVEIEGIRIAGDLAAQGTVGMAEQIIRSEGQANVKNLLVQKDGQTTPVTDADINYHCVLDQASNTLSVPSANLTATPGTVDISNLNLPLTQDGPMTVSLDGKAKLDLGKAWDFAKVFVDTSEEMQISGMLDSTLKATTTGRQVRILAEKTQVDKLRIQRGDDDPFTRKRLDLTGDVLLDLDAKQYDVQKLVLTDNQKPLLEVTKGTYKEETAGTNTKLSGDFEFSYDWDAITPLVAAHLPEGLKLTGKRTDTLHFESDYPTAQPDQMTANLNANASFGFTKAQYNGLNVGQTSMTMNVNKGLLDFEIPRTTVNEGTLQFAGQVDLNAESKVLRLKEPMQVLENIHVNKEITQTMLAKLNPLFADQGNVSGYANLKCDQLEIPFDASETRKLLIDGVIGIDKGQLEPTGLIAAILGKNDARTIKTKMLPTHFVVKDEWISYNSMEFHLDKYPVGFSGRTRFDSYFEPLVILLPKRWDRERIVSSVKLGDDLSERIEVECQGYPRDFLNCIKDILTNNRFIEGVIQYGIEELLKL